jgi:hypothetical protein
MVGSGIEKSTFSTLSRKFFGSSMSWRASTTMTRKSNQFHKPWIDQLCRNFLTKFVGGCSDDFDLFFTTIGNKKMLFHCARNGLMKSQSD